jgi:hypothetical protein
MKKTASILSSFIFAAFLLLPSLSFAAEDRLFIRWKAETFSPSFFSGKGQVSPNATLVLTVAAVSRSKFADLSGKQILWYSNGELVREGVGMESVRFQAPELKGALFEVRVEVPDLGLIETIRIPVVAPEAVLEVPLIDNVMRSTEVTLRVWPFFFVSDPKVFEYRWLVNGKASNASGDPRTLQISLSGASSNAVLNVQMTIQGYLEGAVSSRPIYYRP